MRNSTVFYGSKKRHGGLLALAAALLLPMTAGADDITGVKIGVDGGEPAQATDTADLIATDPTDGANNGLIIKNGSTYNPSNLDANTMPTSNVQVVIEGDTTTSSKDYSVAGGASVVADGNAETNTVTIENTGKITGNVFGGIAASEDGGNAIGNKVVLEAGSTVGDTDTFVVGGGAVAGDAEDNTVEISGGTVNGNVFGGAADLQGNASGNANANTTTITGGTIKGRVRGGGTTTGNVAGNAVNIAAADTKEILIGNSGDQVDQDIESGQTSIGDADNNTVSITATGSGKVMAEGVYGADVIEKGNATDNKVTITGDVNDTGAITIHEVYGGETTEGTASGNTVAITSGRKANGEATATISGNVIGGGTGKGNASSNSVTIDGGDFSGNITGGDAIGGNAASNSVTIKSGAAKVDAEDSAVIGGLAAKGGAEKANATNNTVTVTGSHYSIETDAITGGKTDTGDATGNEVSITATVEGTVSTKSVRGAHVDTKGDVTNNHVTITGADADNSDIEIAGDVYGSYTAQGTASGNTASLTGNVVTTGTAGVIGGYSADGNAARNTVEISGDGVIVEYVFGGASVGGKVTENVVTITDGAIEGEVFGGQLTTATGKSNTVSSNRVTIHGGSFADDAKIAGGAVTLSADDDIVTATNNTVTLSGEIGIGSNVSLLGTYADGSGSSPGAGSDTYTGNTLAIQDSYAGTGTYTSIAGFQNYRFTLSAVPTEAVLTADSVDFGDAAQVSVTLPGDSPALQKGDSLPLIEAAATDGAVESLSVTQGGVLQYTLSPDLANGLSAVVEQVEATEGSKALSEGYLAGVALLNQGGDLLADKGVGLAVRGAAAAGLQGFGAIGGGSVRYDTGSHVDVDGYSLLAGLAFGTGLAPGRLTLGAFFEYGQGDYDSSNSFRTASVKGSGDTEYVGGGLLARLDFTGGEAGHFYSEASFRAGKAESEFSSRDLQVAKYKTDGGYYGLHLGAGYIWKLSEAARLDVHGKYLWSRQDGDSVTLSTSAPVKFDDVDSHRLRIGARLDWKANEQVRPYVGLAYEHEFDGEAKATAYGHAIEAPDLKGGTGIGELGLNFQFGERATLDFGVQGYAGKRDGVTGSLKLKIAF